MPELLGVPMTFLGMFLLIGTLIQGVDKGFDNLSDDDKKYGIGLGGLLVFLAWFF